MKMLWILLLCAASATAVSTNTTPVDQCIQVNAPRPINAYISGCEAQPCLLPQLENAVIEMVFKAPTVLRSMTTTATAYIQAGPVTVPIPYPLGSNGVTCNFLTNTYCPLIKDEVVGYALSMYIEPFMPVNTAVFIEFVIRDETNTPIYCIRAAIRIAEPLSPRATKTTVENSPANLTTSDSQHNNPMFTEQ